MKKQTEKTLSKTDKTFLFSSLFAFSIGALIKFDALNLNFSQSDQSTNSSTIGTLSDNAEANVIQTIDKSHSLDSIISLIFFAITALLLVLFFIRKNHAKKTN